MIKYLLYICLISIFFFDWFYFVLGIGNRYMTWIPEFFSLFLFLFIPAAMGFKKEWRLPPKYSFLLIFYVIHIVTGFIVNSMDTGPIIAGVRQYCKFIPIFLLPAVFRFDERDIITLFKFILIIAFLQVPVTIVQRFVIYAGVRSGDPIGGTLGANTSGTLSVFLLIILSYLVIFYLKEKISLKFFILSFIFLLLPTTLNETKITFLLLPLTVAIPLFFLNKKERQKLSRLILPMIMLSVAFVIFINIYNYFGHHGGILKFYSKEEKVERYTDSRLEPILTSLDHIYHSEPHILLFGYGAGNFSVSFSESMQSTLSLLDEFSEYRIGRVSITKLLFETGFIGTILFFLLIFFIFLDSVKMRKNSNFIGTFALGMISFCAFYSILFIYSQPIDINLFIYLFFFFSGYLVSSKNIPEETYRYTQLNNYPLMTHGPDTYSQVGYQPK